MGDTTGRNFKLGSNIRKIREFVGYSQDYMAAKLDMSQQNYSKIERGETEFSDDKLKQIADILEVLPSRFEDLDEKTVFNYNVLNDNSQFNCLGTGNVYHHQMKPVDEKQLEDENKELKDQISTLSEQVKVLIEKINKLKTSQ